MVHAASGTPREAPGPLWRASKLVGVPVLDPSRIQLGKIVDVLLSRDGSAEYVVIGSGGVFGLDQRQVLIPFHDVRFTNRAIEAPPNPVTTSSTGMPSGTPGAATTGGAVNVNDAAAAARSVGHPDHSMIDLTADQLAKRPSFRFQS